ncbi:Lipid kinase YegS [Sinobacterium norvegicum]|uniref:Probable lipid kinase YegS-like n=1 Tax=Sinobacterium norvegicum TaxID=1641715 RepID=A0ABM9ACC9_9GAMM|nr:lipid kinase YegS [Sinobacterium norvegicum]CAH0990857.1 Lipid kinase YegS [Sinobacterium norvegicum]
MHHIRIILNGKKAAQETVRTAIFNARSHSPVEVRATWEAGDVARLVAEACTEGCQRLVVGGGDGTVKEIVEALMQHPAEQRPELAILPLGTANDFATACQIPAAAEAALTLAQTGSATAVDCVKANDEYFINIASGGFGAHITTTTPVELKNFLGGGAYTLNGLVQSLNFKPYQGRLTLPDQSIDGEVIIGAVCNGRQAGGGQQLAPQALIDDGLLDIIALVGFPPEATLQVLQELRDPSLNGQYIKRFKTPWAEWASDNRIPTNLDGEPIAAHRIRFDIVPRSIRLVLPAHSPVKQG